MIIGDAGYGCLFLLTAAALTVKSKKPSDAVQLCGCSPSPPSSGAR